MPKLNAKGQALTYLSASTSAVVAGLDDVADWDDEELLEGKRRGKDGKFRGRRPAVVPRAVVQEILRRADRIMATSVIPAAQTLLDHAHGTFLLDHRDEALRQSAAKYVLDRAFGKAPERVDLNLSAGEAPVTEVPPWFASVVQELRGEADVIDVTPEEEDDDDWDDDWEDDE